MQAKAQPPIELDHMSAPAKAGKHAQWILAALAFFIALAASLANLLNFSGYTKPGVEIVYLLGGFALISGLLAGVVKIAQPRLSFLFVGLFCGVLVDLNADLNSLWLCGAIAVFAGLARFNERATLQLVAMIFGSVLVFQSYDLLTADDRSPPPVENEAQQLQNPDSRRNNRPAIVHLMLDAYLNFEGMEFDGTHFGDVSAEQEAFYARHGFTTFPQAYSQHVKTVNSMPHMYSFGRGPFATTPQNVQLVVAPPLDYFKELDRLGYRISASTPTFVDLCPNQPMTMCTNYNRSRLGDLLETNLDGVAKAKIIAFTLSQLSQVSGKIVQTSVTSTNRFLGTRLRHPHNHTKLFPLTALRALDDFTANLDGLKAGEARFIHLLVPHDPFMLRPDCTLLPHDEWTDEHGPGAMALREAGYANNVRCLQTKLEELMIALEKTEAGREAIVLLQGDHGARVMDGLPLDTAPELRARDLAMAHSAMFAVRLADQEAQTRMGRYPLYMLMQGWKDGGFHSLETPPQPDPQYYEMDAQWIPGKARELPPFPSALSKN